MLGKARFWIALCACVLAMPFAVQAQSITSAMGTTALTVVPGQTASVSVLVTDASAQPAPNVTVTFQSSNYMIAFQPAAAVLTNTSGIATASFYVPYTTGFFTITATAATISTPLSFFVNVMSGGYYPGTGGYGLVSIVSGNGQIGTASQASRPLVVVVKDNAGNPLPGQPVTWTSVSGQLNITGSNIYGSGFSSVITYTDANGQSAVTVTPTSTVSAYTPTTVTASTYSGGAATFYYTIVPNLVGISGEILNPPADGVLRVEAGQTIPGAIQVRANAPMGPLSNVGLDVTTGGTVDVDPTASCSGGTVMTIGGIATCDLVVGKKTGTATLTVSIGGIATQTLTLQVNTAAPATFEIVQGDGQSGHAGQTLPLALVGLAKDPQGNIVPNSPVTWEISTPGALTLTSPTSTATDYNGRASTRVTLGAIAGTHKVTLKAGKAVATFNITVSASLGPLQKMSGDGQTAVVNQNFSQPLMVQVRDQNGNAVQGVPVSFTISGGSLGAASATTDAQGYASTTVQAGANAGSVVVTASVPNLTPVTFNLTARLPGPTLTADSFRNGASFQTGVVAGGIVTIQAPGMAPGVNGCVGAGTIEGDLPMSLAGVEVWFGGSAAPIFSVCNSNGVEQATVQAPFDLATGPVSVTVRIQGGSTVVNNVEVLPAQPGIFESAASDGRLYAVAVRPDGSIVGRDNPARRGELIRLYATGLGSVLPLAGTNCPGVPGQKVYFPTIVGVAGAGVRVISAEYAENMIGVYIVTFEVPADAAPGLDVPLSIAVIPGDGADPVHSNGSRIAIQ